MFKQRELKARRMEKLTTRELQVLELIALGHSDGEIAQKIQISYCTVRSHIDRAVGKLQAQNRTNAVVICFLSNPIFYKNLESKM